MQLLFSMLGTHHGKFLVLSPAMPFLIKKYQEQEATTGF
uniref:Uncharacterized protein n=1 Tax=Manihot esculenta TaxID=3983 RepID=A0A2C9UTH9_MANES